MEKIIENSEQSMSPLPVSKKTEVTIDFPDAIKEVISGKKIHKLEWGDKEIYGFLNNSILSIHKLDDKIYQWILNDGDLYGTDWIVL